MALMATACRRCGGVDRYCAWECFDTIDCLIVGCLRCRTCDRRALYRRPGTSRADCVGYQFALPLEGAA